MLLAPLFIFCITVSSLVLPQSTDAIGFKKQNAIDATKLDSGKANNSIGQACTGGDVICIGAGTISFKRILNSYLYLYLLPFYMLSHLDLPYNAALGQCSNNIIVSLGPCSAPLSCQVLPLANKPGTSVACTTEQDKLDRIAANGGAAIVTPAALPVVIKQAALPTTTNQAGDFQCVDTTNFLHFTSATASVPGACPHGLCFTRTPPNKNPCIGKDAAQKYSCVLLIL